MAIRKDYHILTQMFTIELYRRSNYCRCHNIFVYKIHRVKLLLFLCPQYYTQMCVSVCTAPRVQLAMNRQLEETPNYRRDGIPLHLLPYPP